MENGGCRALSATDEWLCGMPSELPGAQKLGIWPFELAAASSGPQGCNIAAAAPMPWLPCSGRPPPCTEFSMLVLGCMSPVDEHHKGPLGSKFSFNWVP